MEGWRVGVVGERWEVGVPLIFRFRIRILAFFGPDHDLDAAIELLFFDRPVCWHDQVGLAVTLCLNTIRVDIHIGNQPGLHCFGSALAQVHVVLVASEGVCVAFDPEDGLRVTLDQVPQFLQAGGCSRPQDRGVVIKQKIGRHEDGGRAVAELSRTG